MKNLKICWKQKPKPTEDRFSKDKLEISKKTKTTTKKKKKMEKGINKKDLIYEGKKINFQQFETIWVFGDNIFHVKINIVNADVKQSNLLNVILKFNDIDKTKIKSDKKKKKKHLYECSLWR